MQSKFATSNYWKTKKFSAFFLPELMKKYLKISTKRYKKGKKNCGKVSKPTTSE